MKPRDERGFTLVELLCAIVVLSAVTVAVTQSVLVGFRTTDETSTKLGASADAQILASYFVTDAQSASDVSTTDTACGGVTPIVRLLWTDPGVAPPGTQVVSYALSGDTLVRRVCLNGGAAAEQAVVRDVTAVTCAPCSGSVIGLSVTARGFSYEVAGKRRST